MIKLMKNTKQAGVTLLETILVLSLIAIIMVGGLNLYKNASDATKANDSQREITALATNVRALYSSQSSFNGVTNTVINNAGARPNGMSSSAAANIGNTFGGTVTIAAAGDGGALNGVTVQTDQAFSMILTEIPKSACYKIETTEMGQIGGPKAPADAGLCSSTTVTLYFQ